MYGIGGLSVKPHLYWPRLEASHKHATPPGSTAGGATDPASSTTGSTTYTQSSAQDSPAGKRGTAKAGAQA